MDKKILWFDVETSGLDSKENDIIQIAGIIEVNEKIVDEFNILMQPFDLTKISKEALQVQNRSMSEILRYQRPNLAYKQFTDVLNRHSNKFDKTDKYYVGGYNVNFDMGFLENFFRKMNDPYLGSYLNWTKLDPMMLVQLLNFKGLYNEADCKLGTACKAFGINLDNAHDALADVKATRELYAKLCNSLTFNL